MQERRLITRSDSFGVPRLIVADKQGRIMVHPTLSMLGASGGDLRLPQAVELIALPKRSALFFMPGHVAYGFDRDSSEAVLVSEFFGKRVFPVAAFPIPGYTRLLLPAAHRLRSSALLPLWPYTAIGWRVGRFWIAAIHVDPLTRQRPYYYENRRLLVSNVRTKCARAPRNRLLKHLRRCALEYNCRAAQNLFYGRWEAPLPTSPSCNARCLGCLSFQESECSAASHERIRFVPTATEIAEVAVPHLTQVREAIVSFGQGCEGEPLLQFRVLRDAIKRIRCQTSRGTIHLNTNAYQPDFVRELAQVGLTSIRVSVNSLRNEYYHKYYRPRRYTLSSVMRSIEVAKRSGLFVSLNVLTFPGLSDTREEATRLIRLLKRGCVDLVQLRNLSIDSYDYIRHLGKHTNRTSGMLAFIREIIDACPNARFGYFNLPRERFHIRKQSHTARCLTGKVRRFQSD